MAAEGKNRADALTAEREECQELVSVNVEKVELEKEERKEREAKEEEKICVKIEKVSRKRKEKKKVREKRKRTREKKKESYEKPRPHPKKYHRKKEFERFMEIFKKLEIKVPMIETLQQVPGFKVNLVVKEKKERDEIRKDTKKCKKEKPQVPLSGSLPLSGTQELTGGPLRGKMAAEGKNRADALTAER
ncbi:hypothetical protein LR48_Vigan10g148100 [Vigna angularis]|uniref:Uncharacterized protein n=1 Tax=Phaseolus angularis TaxID=3914 RepID=A0A0L9VLI2_PHAAN|nr:hypothetical protein LR48_Vigan10g148100 [Vigna angularis]